MAQRYLPGMEPIPGHKITRLIGEGSYGIVYKASRSDGVDVALKFISLDGTQGLPEFRAVGLIRKLRHENLVPIHAAWLRDSNGNVMNETSEGKSSSFSLTGKKELVISMGHCDRNLWDCLLETDSKGIPAETLLRYMEDAARGIDYLNTPHRAMNNMPVIHCDIKPHNLLVVGGRVQVSDYGIAKALMKKADLKKTMGVGTTAYAAPELIGNDAVPQTDQYSLAIVYIEMRTGMLPFEESKALVANLTGRLDLSRLTPAEQAVIRRATSIQPDKRFDTCLEMVEKLQSVMGIAPSNTTAQPRPSSTNPKKTTAAGTHPPQISRELARFREVEEPRRFAFLSDWWKKITGLFTKRDKNPPPDPDG